MKHDCHLCGAEDCQYIPGFEDIPRVTSDCKPWPSGGRLYLCSRCGTVQKNTDAFWQDEMKRIYEAYTIYHQSEGEEQPVMVEDGQGMVSRSRLLLDHVASVAKLPEQGRLLDVGCGNGGFLRTSSQVLPNWSLAGTEFDGKYKPLVERIPGVEVMHTGTIAGLTGYFHVISMLHVLEHIPWPTALLESLREKLAPGGLLLLNLPDLKLNPFELAVADHCTHFQRQSIACFLQRLGFRVELDTTTWIKKERVVLARVGAVGSCEASIDLVSKVEEALGSVNFLRSMVDAAHALRGKGEFAIFGSSIAATWLAGAINGEFEFFVDGDKTRIGRRHLGKPILGPHEVAPGSRVLIALSREISGLLKANFETLRPDVEWLLETDVLGS